MKYLATWVLVFLPHFVSASIHDWGCSNEQTVIIPYTDLPPIERPITVSCPSGVNVTGNVVRRISATAAEIVPPGLDVYDCTVAFDSDVYRLRSIELNGLPMHLPEAAGEVASIRHRFDGVEVTFSFYAVDADTARYSRISVGALVQMPAIKFVRIKSSNTAPAPMALFDIPAVTGGTSLQALQLGIFFPLTEFVNMIDMPRKTGDVVAVYMFTDHCNTNGSDELHIYAKTPLVPTIAFEMTLRQLQSSYLTASDFKKASREYTAARDVILNITIPAVVGATPQNTKWITKRKKRVQSSRTRSQYSTPLPSDETTTSTPVPKETTLLEGMLEEDVIESDDMVEGDEDQEENEAVLSPTLPGVDINVPVAAKVIDSRLLPFILNSQLLTPSSNPNALSSGFVPTTFLGSNFMHPSFLTSTLSQYPSQRIVSAKHHHNRHEYITSPIVPAPRYVPAPVSYEAADSYEVPYTHPHHQRHYLKGMGIDDEEGKKWPWELADRVMLDLLEGEYRKLTAPDDAAPPMEDVKPE